MSINCVVIHDIANLKPIIDSPILITSNNALQDEETAMNMWCLSIDLARIISINDLLDFVSSLLNKRTQQVIDAGIAHPVVFYMWFDEMAGQLRFNIISDFGSNKLPFGCQLEIVDSPKSILEDFLTSHYHAGIPRDEIEELNDDYLDENDQEEPFVLKVFVAQLK